jgi:hypothetical protein
MDSVTFLLMVPGRRRGFRRLRAILPYATGLLCIVSLPAVPISAAEVAPCNPATLAQAWGFDFPQDPAEGSAPVLLRQQAAPDGTSSSTQRIVLPIAQPQPQGPAPEELRPRVLWGDPASPFLFLYAISTDETQPWLHFMVLCRGGDKPRVVEHAVLKTDFPLVVDTGSAAEAPGNAFAVPIGERHALLWRNRAPTGRRFKPRLLTWPKPVRALSVVVGDRLRVLALSDDGALYQYQYQSDQTAAPSSAKPVPGWPATSLPTRGRVWLHDAGRWLYLLTEQGGGRRFELGTHRNESLYGADDGRLVARDWFYSRNGRNTALFLLLAKGAGGQTGYHARLYDLGRGVAEPILDMPFVDKGSGAGILDQQGNPLPQVFLQDWSANEDFSQIDGFLFHNRNRKGLIDRLRIVPEWDPAQWRQVPTLRLRTDQREETPQEILPHQVSVLTDGRRRRIFYFSDTLGYTQPFTDPAELP